MVFLFESAVSEGDSKGLTVTVEAANSLSNSMGETVEKVKSLNEPTVQEQPNIPTGEQEYMGSDGSVSQVNMQTIPFLSEGEAADGKSVPRSVKFDVPYGLGLDSGCVYFSTFLAALVPFLFLYLFLVCFLMLSRPEKLKQQEASIPETGPEISLEPVSFISNLFYIAFQA